MIGRRCHITPLYVFPNHHIHEQINNNNRPFERQLDLDSLDIHTWFEEKKKGVQVLFMMICKLKGIIRPFSKLCFDFLLRR
jgi:hypothetical protein